MAKTLQAGFFRGFQVTLLVRPHLLSERYLDRLQLLESSKFGRVRRHFKRNRLQRPSGMEKSLWSSDLQDQKPLYMSRHRPRPPNCQSVYPARSHSRHHPFAQIQGIGSRHQCWPPTPASILNQIRRPLGIPFRFRPTQSCSRKQLGPMSPNPLARRFH